MEYAASPSAFPADPLRILVHWEPGARGDAALAGVAWLARTTNIKVQCITTFLRPWAAPKVSKIGSKYKKWFKKEAQACEEALKTALKEHNIHPESWHEPVSIFADGTNGAQLITDAAQQLYADLILLSSQSSSPKGKIFANSTADALLHSSTQPVGLMPAQPKLSKKGVTRINFAMLEPELDAATVQYVAGIAAEWQTPLRLVALSPTGFGEPPISDSLELPENLALEWRESTFAHLDRCRDQIQAHLPQIRVETEIGFGNGWDGALDAIKWKKGDLLCLGSTPVGALERVFIGTQTSEILPHVRVPVFMVPAKISDTNALA